MKLLFDADVASILRAYLFSFKVNPVIIHTPKLLLMKGTDIYSYLLDIKDQYSISTNGSSGKQTKRDFVISPYYTAISPPRNLNWIIIPTSEPLQYYAVLTKDCTPI